MPNKLIVHIWPAASGLPSASPYCVKVIRAAEYKKIPHEVKIWKFGPPKWARHGKLPVAEVAGRKIEDSTAILKAMDECFPESSRLYPTDPALRADALLLEDWADECLTLFAAYYRWATDHHFVPFSNETFAAVPNAVRWMIVPMARKNIVRTLENRGIGLDSEDMRKGKFQENIWLLEQKLAKRRFLVSDQPTAADFAVYPTLRILLNAKIGELTPFIEGSPVIRKWLSDLEFEMRVVTS